MLPDPLRVTLRVAEVLEGFQVPYMVGGSLASSLHGVARATLDADIVADLTPQDALRFCSALQGEFYVDLPMILDSIGHSSSFNVIHLETMFKVDIFPCKQRPYSRIQIDRRERHIVEEETGRTLVLASAEDTVLAKLRRAFREAGVETDDNGG